MGNLTTPSTALKPAALRDRLLAYLIDWSAVLVVTPVIVRLSFRSLRPDFALVLPIAFAYFFIGIAFTGQTIGKKLIKMRVVRANGSALGWVQVLLRSVFSAFPAPLMVVSYLVALFDKKKSRAAHDWLANSIVVKEA